MKSDMLWSLPLLTSVLLRVDAAGPVPPAAYQQQPSDVLFKPRDGMGNVLVKLRAGEKVKIAYIGGSITAAQGWRIKSLDWFKQQYPKAEIEQVCAALGGTGSDLGVYRIDREVLPKNPDLIFIEFARNNSHLSAQGVWETMEGMVRKLWALNPRMDIVFVYCAVQSDQQKDWDNDLMPLHDSAADQVAAFYGIPSVNLGYGITQLERAGKALCGPMRFSLVSKCGPDWWSEDWWFGWQTSCDWKTEARDHWITFGFNANAVRLFDKEPRVRLRENAWQHLALTRKGATYSLYLDGKAVAVETNATAIRKPGTNVFSKLTGPLLLGTLIPRGPHGELHALKGSLDDTAIFKGALDADAVRKLSEGTASPQALGQPGTGGVSLVAFWDFEQTQGTMLTDRSDAKADGVLTSFGEKHKDIATNSWWSTDVPRPLKGSERSLHFAGGHMKSKQGEHVEVPSLGTLDLDGDFTISLWVKPETLGVSEKMIFVDTIHPLNTGHEIYTGFLAEAIKAMEGSKPVDHGAKLDKVFTAGNWSDARMVQVEPKYLVGDWQQMSENDPIVRPYPTIIGPVWASQTPGAQIHFTFKGRGFGLFDFGGPDTGQLIVTIDGVRQEKTVSRFYPWSRGCGPCMVPIASDLDPTKIHEVTLEIHPDEPDRRGIWGPFGEGGRDAELSKPMYRGKWIRAGALMLLGDIAAP